MSIDSVLFFFGCLAIVGHMTRHYYIETEVEVREPLLDDVDYKEWRRNVEGGLID